jgi:dipeptidyl aminopeptidase/acylaminoacyl peptidase
MTRTTHRSIAGAAFWAALLFCGCTTPPPPAAETPAALLAAPAAMRTEGVPALPRTQIDAAQRYSRVAGHGFVDWHPTRREMLVSHRAPGASTTQLFLLRIPGARPEPLTDGSDPVSNARWEPREGRYLVFSRGSGGDEAFQLFRLDPETRAATQITPSGQRHALLDWVKSRSLALVSSVPLDRTAAGGRRSEVTTTLSLIDPLNPAAARVVAELPGGGWTNAEVSPDEKQLALSRYVSATESEVWLLDLGSGQRRRLLPAPGESVVAAHLVEAWSPDGRALFITSDRAGEFKELMRVEVASGALTRLTAHTPWDVDYGGASRDGRTVALVANVDGRDELRLVDAATGVLRPAPTLPAGSVTRATFHHSRDELAVVVSGAQGPAQIHTLELAGAGTATAWTTPVGTEGLDLKALPEQQVVRWTSFDGRTVSGLLTLPPASFPGRRPVAMLVHGGPEGQAKLGWQGRTNHLVMTLGIAVFQPNVRGSAGYGKTYLSLDNGRLREDSVKDMGTAIDWMATQPRLDATRVVVSGGSYGGYMALAASTLLADRIAGAVSAVGISNFVSFLENTESYRRDLRRAEYGDERDPAMRAFLQQISPLNRVDRISKPLMVVQGRNDPRVPWTESEQIVRSLQQRGSPVWYLLAANEGHGFARRENSDYYFAAMLQFLQQTLKL